MALQTERLYFTLGNYSNIKAIFMETADLKVYFCGSTSQLDEWPRPLFYKRSMALTYTTLRPADVFWTQTPDWARVENRSVWMRLLKHHPLTSSPVEIHTFPDQHVFPVSLARNYFLFFCRPFSIQLFFFSTQRRYIYLFLNFILTSPDPEIHADKRRSDRSSAGHRCPPSHITIFAQKHVWTTAAGFNVHS